MTVMGWYTYHTRLAAEAKGLAPWSQFAKFNFATAKKAAAGAQSNNASLEARRHQGAEFPALRDERLLPVAAQDHRRLHRAPAQPGHDGFDAAARPGAIVTA